MGSHGSCSAEQPGDVRPQPRTIWRPALLVAAALVMALVPVTIAHASQAPAARGFAAASPQRIADVVEIGHPAINAVKAKPPFEPELWVSMTVRTVIEPHKFYMHVTLWKLINPVTSKVKETGSYAFLKSDLPPVGQRKRLSHSIALCVPAKYYSRWDVYTVSDTGLIERYREYWPYKNWNARDKKKHIPDPQRPPTVRQMQKVTARECGGSP